MENPFEALDQRLSGIESKLENLIEKLENHHSTSPTWLSSKHLAEYLSISLATVTKLRGAKVPYYKMGGKVYFKKQEIDEWIEKTRHKSGEEYLNEYLNIR